MKEAGIIGIVAILIGIILLILWKPASIIWGILLVVLGTALIIWQNIENEITQRKDINTPDKKR
tara:strand:- start:2231 stop:2422 length:192 start_codon:yes stop_codon:yes gene_type:complete